jgi:cytochrome c oxidase subunit I+III
MHGVTMMFLFAVPMLEGFGIYIVPMMIGTRDMAFPRLNAFGYYVYLIAGVVLYVAFFLGDRSRRGVVQLRSARVSAVLPRHPHRHLGDDDHLPRGLGAGGRGRAGRDHPQAARSRDVAGAHARVRLVDPRDVGDDRLRDAVADRRERDAHARPDGGHAVLRPFRQGATRCSGSTSSGSSATPRSTSSSSRRSGFVSQIVTTFSRRRLFGYTAIVLSQVAIGIVSFGLWVHHMFTTGAAAAGDRRSSPRPA